MPVAVRARPTRGALEKRYCLDPTDDSLYAR